MQGEGACTEIKTLGLPTSLNRVDLYYMVSDEEEMALTGLKPPGPLQFEGHLASNWKRWYRAYDHYTIAVGASGKAERVQCSLFLHVAGPEAQTLQTQFTYESDEEEKIQPMIRKFKAYFLGKSNITVVRYRFNSYNQTTETMETYIRELKARIVECDYGNVESSLLCDRLVCGVADNKLRMKLLQTENLTTEQCMSMCRLSEIGIKDVKPSYEMTDDKELDAIVNDRRGQYGRPIQAWRKPVEADSGTPRPACGWCGFSHPKDKCPAKGKECNICRKIGHFGKVCRSRVQSSRPVHMIHKAERGPPSASGYSYQMEEEEQAQDDYSGDLYVGELNSEKKGRPSLWYASYHLGHEEVRFKIDTGSEVNIIPLSVYRKLHNTPLRPVKYRIIAYSGHRVQPEGEATICINNCKLCMVVIKGGSPILGKSACEQLQLVARIGMIEAVNGNEESNATDCNSTVKLFSDVFQGLGLIETDAHIHVDPSVEPSIDPPRRIPHAIKDRVKIELDRMLDLGVIIEQTEPTEWVNSITIVRKPDKIRICLDPTKLNRAIKRGAYPVRTVEEVSAKLHGSKVFSVLDAKSGYWQIQLDEYSSRLCTFNTPWGRYRYTRLPFGIKTAGDIFIGAMNNMLGDLPGVEIITDDILIHGRDINEHNTRLKNLLKRAVKINLKLNPCKSKIGQSEVEYVGHVITQYGLLPNPKRVQAINDMPEPTDKIAVQRFLGMVNYVHKFIPNLSQIAEPLRVILKKNVVWHWGHEQQSSFDKMKKLLRNAPVLGHFDTKAQITLQVDASKSGLGATIIQHDKPVAMASRALNAAQTQYAVIEKELLAMCFGVTRFHEYIYGQQIIIQTDHKPLVGIMNKPIFMLSARMQRMRMRLQNYNMTIQYINGKNMFFADTFSRAHTTDEGDEDMYDNTLSIAAITEIAIDIERIQKESRNDKVLIAVTDLVVNGWPETKIPEEAKPYHTYRNELTVDNKLLMKGERIVVPKILQKEMIDTLHKSHQGITKTLQLAREFVFWPGMTANITDKISRCSTCQSHRNNIHHEPLISHQIPNIPFYKIGADLFEVEHEHYLLIVDYYSKYPEVVKLTSTTSKQIIEKLQEVFARFGIPKTVVTDNGPQFKSLEYSTFAKNFGFEAVYSSPQYPQSNGQIERCVQTIKRMIIKTKEDNQNIYIALLDFRNTPITGLTISPAQLLLSRRLRSKIPTTKDRLRPQIQPDRSTEIALNQINQKVQHDRNMRTTHKMLKPETKVRYRDSRNNWAKGIIKTVANKFDRSYNIENQKDKRIRRNRCLIVPDKSIERQQQNNGNETRGDIHSTIHTPRSRYGRILRPVLRQENH